MFLTILIAIFASLSYSFGVVSVFRGKYKPSIYSRLVWLLIATNSLIGVIALKNNAGTLVLASISAFGCLLMLIGSWKYSVRTFGTTELICSLLLVLSAVLWLVVDDPIVNVILGLTAHLIGAIPSFIAVIKRPSTENLLFWLFFAIASILAFIQADKTQLDLFIYALYYALFDTTMTLLTARQFVSRPHKRTA